jgi:hypothetical protein
MHAAFRRRLKRFVELYDPKPNDLINPGRPWVVQCAKLAKDADIAWYHNALRHGFASHRRRLTRNLPFIANEMGTSVEYLETNYTRPVDIRDSRNWFELSEDDVVPGMMVVPSMKISR